MSDTPIAFTATARDAGPSLFEGVKDFLGQMFGTVPLQASVVSSVQSTLGRDDLCDIVLTMPDARYRYYTNDNVLLRSKRIYRQSIRYRNCTLCFMPPAQVSNYGSYAVYCRIVDNQTDATIGIAKFEFMPHLLETPKVFLASGLMRAMLSKEYGIDISQSLVDKIQTVVEQGVFAQA